MVFFLSDVNQNLYRVLAVAALEHESFFATVSIFETVKRNEVPIAYLVHDAPDLASRLRKDIRGAALAQLRVARDGEAIIRQAGHAKKPR